LAKPNTTTVDFTISFDGSFKDVTDSVEYMYYKPVRISAIKPHMGPKDGGSTI
jgi:hypothetical protein